MRRRICFVTASSADRSWVESLAVSRNAARSSPVSGATRRSVTIICPPTRSIRPAMTPLAPLRTATSRAGVKPRAPSSGCCMRRSVARICDAESSCRTSDCDRSTRSASVRALPRAESPGTSTSASTTLSRDRNFPSATRVRMGRRPVTLNPSMIAITTPAAISAFCSPLRRRARIGSAGVTRVPGAGVPTWSSNPTSVAADGRLPGSFASRRPTSGGNDGERSCRNVSSDGASLVSCAARMARGVVPLNGVWPVSISNPVTPRA